MRGVTIAQMGFFDLSDRYASLDAKRDPLGERRHRTLPHTLRYSPSWGLVSFQMDGIWGLWNFP
jgi:hypothetical protein